MKNQTFKTIVLLFAMGLLSKGILAQGSYFTLHAGYAFQTASQDVFTDFIKHAELEYTYNESHFSFGKGFAFGAAYGYMFNKNVGAELGLSYFLSAASTFKKVYLSATENREFSSKMLQIRPAIVLETGVGKLDLYSKFGLLMGIGFIEDFFYVSDNAEKQTLKMKYKGGMALGLTGSIGTLFKLNDRISLFSEISLISLSYAPTKGEVTEVTVNGIDHLQDLTVSQKEVRFVDSYTIDYTNPPPDSEPAKTLKKWYPFSSIGINIGLRYRLK